MKALGDFIHNKGLKFGVYSSAGTLTCAGRAGGLDYEEIDAKDYASWGVDYLKYDNCNHENRPALERYTKMRDALNATGREIFYSICNWGEDGTHMWGPSLGNSWRTTQDIEDLWGSVEYNFWLNSGYQDIAGPGGWNDPDMLEVGNGGLSHEEEKTHFALWAVSKAPLIIGCDLTTVSNQSLAILSNKELIAVNQDPAAEQARCVQGCNSWIHTFLRRPTVYATKKSNGDIVAVIVNWRELHYDDFEIDLNNLNLYLSQGDTLVVKDLYENAEIDSLEQSADYSTETYKVGTLFGHGCKALKFSVKSN